MGSLAKGAISGVIAGTAYGIVFAVFGYVTLLGLRDSIIGQLSSSLLPGSSYTPDQAFNMALAAVPFFTVAAGLGGGAVLGAVYGSVFERIPGKVPIARGFVFGIVFWLVFSVLGGLGNLSYGVGYYLTEAAIGLATALLFGCVLGYSYGRFTRRNQAEVSGNGALSDSHHRSPHGSTLADI